MQPDTQRVGRDREARVHARRSRQCATVYHVEVVDPAVSTVSIEWACSPIEAHPDCSERMGKRLDEVHERETSARLAQYALRNVDQDCRGSIVTRRVPVMYP
jgi:hypothetical protein